MRGHTGLCPGFINLTVANTLLGELLADAAADERLGVAPAAEPERVAVGYSAPNAAKEMHVGHLRSTIIRDAVVRPLEWQGHTVIRQNHIGEWGTPFGMLIEHLLDAIGGRSAARPSTRGGGWPASLEVCALTEHHADRDPGSCQHLSVNRHC